MNKEILDLLGIFRAKFLYNNKSVFPICYKSIVSEN